MLSKSLRPREKVQFFQGCRANFTRRERGPRTTVLWGGRSLLETPSADKPTPHKAARARR